MRDMVDRALMLGVALVVLLVVWAYAVPPASSTTPGTPPATLDECVAALYSLDAESFERRQDLDEVGATLVLVEADRDRLSADVVRAWSEVDRLSRQVERLKARLKAARR